MVPLWQSINEFMNLFRWFCWDIAIVGFKFKVLTKAQPKNVKQEAVREGNTAIEPETANKIIDTFISKKIY